MSDEVQLLCGDARAVLASLPAQSVHTCLDLECAAQITRLQPGRVYLVRVPASVSDEDLRDIAVRLAQAVSALPAHEQPTVALTRDDVSVEDVTEGLLAALAHDA